jgi:hypothetical protein
VDGKRRGAIAPFWNCDHHALLGLIVLLYLVDDPGGSPLSQKMTVTNLYATAQPIVFAAQGETITNATDDTIAFLSNDENTTVAIVGFEAKEARLLLQADQGDDLSDTWELAAQTDGVMTIGTDSAVKGTIVNNLTLAQNGDASVLGDLTVTGADLSIAAAGVKLTGANGAVTILGLGDGTDEDLKIDLNAANVATITSSTGVDNIVGLNSYSFGAAGVKITGDGDGAITLLGLGNGSDEDLTINLDDTANTVVLSSSTGVTSISTGAIGLTSTGTVTQAASVLTPTAIASLGAATAGKMVMTSDSGAADDCTTAGGTGVNMCIGDGSAFVFLKSVKASA